jgi:acetylornithine deacetylase/succinyl-diaminopimelate desuccinylase-like protein
MGEQNLNAILELSRRLIEFQTTVNRLDEREAIIEFCRQKITPQAKVTVQRFKKNPLLLASLKGQGPRICFYSHLDVIGGLAREFRPKVKKGRLYGRGSGDMKGAAAVMIQLFNDLAEQPTRPNLDLLLTTDEEVGGADGAGAILKKKYRCDVAIIPDNGTGLTDLILEQKGMLELRLWRKGKPAHGARPQTGINALELLWKDYERIKKIFTPDRKKTWGTTLNLGQLFGGMANNQVPSHAEMFLDIRYSTPRQHQKILHKIGEISKHVQILLDVPPFMQDKENEFTKRYKKCVENQLGKKVNFSREAGASDARFFSHYGISSIVTGIAKKNIHAENEWCSVSELESFYEILKEFVGATDRLRTL